jgi:hypothetical protein
VGLLASSQTPNLEDQVILFVWVITLDPSGMGGPTNSIHYRQRISWDHVTTQAPPLRQSRDTFGGAYYLDALNTKVRGCANYCLLGCEAVSCAGYLQTCRRNKSNFHQTTHNRITQGSIILYFSVFWSTKIPLD